MCVWLSLDWPTFQKNPCCDINNKWQKVSSWTSTVLASQNNNNMDSKFVGQPALEQDSLETLLATEPTSTDLDLLAGLETTSDCQQDTKLEQATSVVEADQQKTSGNNSKTSSNDEDSLTVRYFPIVKMATQSATRQTVQDYANYGGQQQQAPINETTPRPAACNRQQLQQQQQQANLVSRTRTCCRCSDTVPMCL